MNFYLDFEATQFTQRIISMGCVTEDGDSFYTLVKLCPGDKISNFITQLTGIDKTLLEEKGIEPAAALVSLRDFIETHSNRETNFFYVYGNSDKEFLRRTIEKCKDSLIQLDWYYSLAECLIDYTTFVKRFFKTDTIALVKAAAWFKNDIIYQNHNSLEDAEMLRYVALGIKTTLPPDKNPWASEMEERARKRQENIIKQNNLAAQNIKMVKAVSIITGKEIFFRSINEASNYVHDNWLEVKLRKSTPYQVMKKRIKSAAKTGNSYFNYKWSIIENVN